MIKALPVAQTTTRSSPTKSMTVWGLTPHQLFNAYWASRGVQCIRQGEPQRIDRTVDLYLLLEPKQFIFFDLASLIDRIAWRGARVTRLRVSEPNEAGSYFERIRLDDHGFVSRIDRMYKPVERNTYRALITHRAHFARLWMHAQHPRAGWREIRKRLPVTLLDRLRVRGSCFREDDPVQQRRMVNHLVANWRDPDRSIDGIKQIAPGVWTLAAESHSGATLVGPLWLGCGRMPGARDCIIGPEWRDDDVATLAKHKATASVLELPHIESSDPGRRLRRSRERSIYPIVKRSFDVMVSASLLVLLSPVIFIIAAAIAIDSGFPVLFSHRRESVGGKPFDCLKFRTMRKDAETLVSSLAQMNQCDGPQVNIQDDPRVTRIGRVLRRFHLDELPQLWNVLKGEMSLVGPRPSPEHENQYCPAWRELRLSVRPGITGLWQLKRTRAPGKDFQEWIKYDIEYVRRANFWLDMSICFRTAYVIVFGRENHEAI